MPVVVAFASVAESHGVCKATDVAFASADLRFRPLVSPNCASQSLPDGSGSQSALRKPYCAARSASVDLPEPGGPPNQATTRASRRGIHASATELTRGESARLQSCPLPLQEPLACSRGACANTSLLVLCHGNFLGAFLAWQTSCAVKSGGGVAWRLVEACRAENTAIMLMIVRILVVTQVVTMVVTRQVWDATGPQRSTP